MSPNLRIKKLFIYIAFFSIIFSCYGLVYGRTGSIAVGGTNTKAISLDDKKDTKRILTAEVSGVEGDALENVSARLKINLRAANEGSEEDEVKNFYNRAPFEIKEALKPFGYFRPQITSKLVREGKDQWRAYFHIIPRDAVQVTEVVIHILGEGADDPEFQLLKNRLLQKLKSTLNVKHYEDAKQDLYELAEARGYFKSSVIESRISIDKERYQAQLYILFNTGNRYHFGPVIFSPTPLSDRFLQRYVQFKVGEPYSELKVERLEKDLSNSNYFQKVSIERQIGMEEVPIKVNLEPKKARQYVIGAGWGTDTLARGVFGINFRRLNSQGHQLRTEAIVSERRSTAKAIYIIPGKNPAIDQYRISASTQKLNENPGNANNEKLDISYITAYKKWHPIFSLGFLNERFQFTDFPVRQHEKLIIPSFSASRSYANDPLRPTKGYEINFNVRGADRRVLGKHSFSQIRLDLKGLYSLTTQQRVLLAGSVAKTNIDNIFHLPLSLQYFAGGPQSVRGYGFLHIGPGKCFTFLSGEFQRQIKGNLYFSVFYDVGSVSERFFKHLKRSPGVGLVYLSPIGDISLSVAAPLDKNFPHKDKHVRIQFSMGSELFGFSSKD